MGPVTNILTAIYGKTALSAHGGWANLRSITFIGTVVGQLFFGWTSDHISRKWSLLVSTIILILFAILSTAAYSGGDLGGMLNALIAYRFFVGIGIGGEYPAGSVGAAEHSGSLRKGTRNRWFIMFTNVQIDLGFVVAYLVAMIVVRMGEVHLNSAWRICLGLGVIPPLSLLYLRLKISEPETYTHERMLVKDTPWLLIFRYYWWRLTLVSLIWFIYDFCSYSFSNFSSDIISNFFVATNQPNILWKNLGWGCFMNFWYLPGAIGGSFLADQPWCPPRFQLIGALVLQGIIGFGIAGGAYTLDQPNALGGFVILNGIFLALGEVGPGDLIGLFASKTSATCIR
jgi:MFS family permease